MTTAQLKQQRAAGFRSLRFTPALEHPYRAECDQALRERARPVTASALVLFLLYAVLDLAMLPADLAYRTIAVRIFFTCPLIGVVWWLSYRSITPTTFVRCYAAAYIAGGLSVVIIIALARLEQYPMPYDGILLMLMFGYFVMGLPFRTVALASAVVILMYLAMELAAGIPARELTINGFFIATANIIGMVGSWLSEYRQRAHFLDRQLLDASRREAELESTRNTHLITVASHDLRHPLNVISLMLENLTADGLPPSQAFVVTRLKASVTHFNSLLASVLDMSRIHEGMVCPEPRALDTRLVLQQLIDTCADAAADRHIDLRVSPDSAHVGVLADPQLLHRALQNLVVNALEHSDASTVSLRAERQDHQVRFSVMDDGRGIGQTTRAHVFEPYVRADTSAQANPGLGLGLAIVKELSGLMAGVCGVTSEVGQGSDFWLSLPAAKTPVAASNVPAPWSCDAGGEHQLLVVEDHAEACHWICETLRNWGFSPVAFATAEQALDYGQHSPSGLLISDLHLPAMSGQQLFNHLMTQQSIRGGILMTADTERPEGYDRQHHLWVLHKPLSPMRLRAAIQQLTHTADIAKSTPKSTPERGPGPHTRSGCERRAE